MNKKVLVLFERSGAVSVPFREAGFDVTTVDIEPHMVDNDHHICADLRNVEALSLDFNSFDLLVAFPPCTYFSKAGLRYLHTQPGRKEKQLADLEMVKKLWALPIKHKCFENPGGSALNKLWKKSNCVIDYCEFADFKKKTCLWLDHLPPLLPKFMNFKNYGIFIENLRGFRRSQTPIEVGYAMVEQWSGLLD